MSLLKERSPRVAVSDRVAMPCDRADRRRSTDIDAVPSRGPMRRRVDRLDADAARPIADDRATPRGVRLRAERASRRRSRSESRPTAQSSLPSWIIGSSSLVFRSTARTIVRSSTPSGLAATAGMIWRESGRLNRTVKVPSGRSWTGSPWRVTLALGSVVP